MTSYCIDKRWNCGFLRHNCRFQAQQLGGFARHGTDHGEGSAGRQAVQIVGNRRRAGENDAVDALAFTRISPMLPTSAFHRPVNGHDVHGRAAAPQFVGNKFARDFGAWKQDSRSAPGFRERPPAILRREIPPELAMASIPTPQFLLAVADPTTAIGTTASACPPCDP